MNNTELYQIATSLIGKEITDMSVLVPILEDIKQNEESLYSRLRSILRDYKTHLAERICDNRQTSLFDEDETEE